MGIEIERKFLLANDGWRAQAERSVRMAQGYLNEAGSVQSGRQRASVRVRIAGDEAFLNLKSRELGHTRQEFEYAIPVADAQDLLTLCSGGLVDKIRHYVGRWEIDEFLGDNAGLFVAEIELASADEVFAREPWLGAEVTDAPRYYNLALAARPYAQWTDEEKLGMLVIGIAGPALAEGERDWLRHPAVGGVILFTRNFASREQVTALCDELRRAAAKPLLICVDQEGGPVQRFREGFSRLPELARFGTLHDADRDAALAQATERAWLMASEIRALGIDLSFAPVVDLKRGNRAIGERAFHVEPRIAAELGRAYVRGMHAAGMAATLKHFPGHGSVLEDTHFDAAVDARPLETLRAEDLLPFEAGIAAGAEAVMMAHVSYPAVDADPAGYSRRWIALLREDLGFRGVVFSDDIGMAAAESAGGVAARIHAHYDAGCDSVLVCAPSLVPDSLAAMENRPLASDSLHALLGRAALDWDALVDAPRWREARATLGIDA